MGRLLHATRGFARIAALKGDSLSLGDLGELMEVGARLSLAVLVWIRDSNVDPAVEWTPLGLGFTQAVESDPDPDPLAGEVGRHNSGALDGQSRKSACSAWLSARMSGDVDRIHCSSELLDDRIESGSVTSVQA